MKLILLISIICSTSYANANLDHCLKDSKTHGNHINPVSPSPECESLVKAHAERVELKSPDGKYHLFGLGSLLYVSTDGKIDLLAGDQTELSNILKIEINQEKKRLLVLEKNSVSTYRLNFIGNVTPTYYFKSPILKNATRVKLLDNEDMLAILSPSSVRIINSDAETRPMAQKLKPKLLNEISGEDSQLKNPTDLLLNTAKTKFFVLDSDRLLVFPSNVKKDQAPIKIISLEDARSLLEKNGQLFYLNSKGQQTAVAGED